MAGVGPAVTVRHRSRTDDSVFTDMAGTGTLQFRYVVGWSLPRFLLPLVGLLVLAVPGRLVTFRACPSGVASRLASAAERSLRA
jgi:hypothetical protein